MKFTIAKDKEDNYPVIDDNDWRGFVALLHEMSLADIQGANKDECKGKAYALTACTFNRDGRRLKVNATAADFIWLDCEDGQPHELDKAVDGLRGMGLEAVVYTSAGHAPPADRFRIMVPLSSPITDHGDYRRVCLHLQSTLEVNVDRGKLTMYALLFQPARYSSAAENLFLHLTGSILSAEEWLSVCPPAPAVVSVPTIPLTSANLPTGYVEAAVKGEIARINAAIPSQRHDAILIAAIRLAELAKAGVMDWHMATGIIIEHGVGKVGHGRRQEVQDIVDYAWNTARPREIAEETVGRISMIKNIRAKTKERKYGKQI